MIGNMVISNLWKRGMSLLCTLAALAALPPAGRCQAPDAPADDRRSAAHSGSEASPASPADAVPRLPMAAIPKTATIQTSATARKDVLTSFEQQWGIKILSLRHTAGGYMIAFRFRVLDADKAASIFKREDQPCLIDQATKAQFIVPSPPKVGPLRSSGIKPQVNRNYFILFANPGIYVKRGNKVTLAVGKFKATDLLVE